MDAIMAAAMDTTMATAINNRLTRNKPEPKFCRNAQDFAVNYRTVPCQYLSFQLPDIWVPPEMQAYPDSCKGDDKKQECSPGAFSGSEHPG